MSSSDDFLGRNAKYEEYRTEILKLSELSVSRVEKPRKHETWIPKLVKVVEYTDKAGNKDVVEVGKYKKKKKSKIWKGLKGNFDDHSLVFKNKLLLHGNHVHQEHLLEINSESLQELFREIAKPYKELDLRADPIVLKPPFQCIFFLRQKLEAILDHKSTSPTLKQEIQELLGFFEMDPIFQTLSSEYTSTVKRGSVNFDLLWTLYPPQEIVYYAHFYNSNTVLEWCMVIEKTVPSEKELMIHYVAGFHDGRSFSIVTRRMAVPEFHGFSAFFAENGSTRFPIPLSMLPADKERDIRTRLVKRGKRYIDLSTRPHSYLSYTGPVRMLKKDEEKRLSFKPDDGVFRLDWWVRHQPFPRAELLFTDICVS
jgi:hypothetical protein